MYSDTRALHRREVAEAARVAQERAQEEGIDMEAANAAPPAQDQQNI